ncbi:MAG TPA: hypothetical protein VFV09_06505 [Actinomycetota bacterium]|nr:hypothetical protein [Actinomycetota bacterium]
MSSTSMLPSQMLLDEMVASRTSRRASNVISLTSISKLRTFHDESGSVEPAASNGLGRFKIDRKQIMPTSVRAFSVTKRAPDDCLRHHRQVHDFC